MITTPVAPGPLPALSWGTARLLAGTTAGRADLAAHRAAHDPAHPYDRNRLTAALEAVRLLGRGGAGFPVATKLRATRSGPRTSVVVNGSEGEPAGHKDRTLMRRAPHLVLDGALTVARALDTDRVHIVVADPAAYISLVAAVREREDARTVRVVPHDHGYVAGEVRAVTRALSGAPALPPGRRVLPTVHGVHGRPTFASNVETFAQIGLLAGLGVDEFASVGASDEPGTTLLTLIGDVPHAGLDGGAVVEVPTGLPLAVLVGAAGGPVLVGGYHGTWIDGPRDLVLSRPTLRAAGVPLNAGILARLPTTTCALGEVTAVAGWLAGESAGQCGPCYFGLPTLARTLHQLLGGAPVEDEVRARTGLLRGRGACAHPDGASAFVASALTVLVDEVRAHRAHGSCGRPWLEVLPTRATTGGGR
ncbi:NADH-ubiquinone oxidoreductase-F iron-sulfur binding region domain-containing protein [Nocardioides sp. L-11A]|uniref:NADH-ubiquinone oxidoreductase-F iron-sulfur binding region domain-containing protein n=1 Tax=Nocardioides sp. L-11A TaxID=3043848 RepID=UPI00249C1BCA|nr:NADH-ubiquinone oxidoreductase-F iron-sulfur binding region domain-containing protein [Nocardioides sp. L-11A]